MHLFCFTDQNSALDLHGFFIHLLNLLDHFSSSFGQASTHFLALDDQRCFLAGHFSYTQMFSLLLQTSFHFGHFDWMQRPLDADHRWFLPGHGSATHLPRFFDQMRSLPGQYLTQTRRKYDQRSDFLGHLLTFLTHLPADLLQRSSKIGHMDPLSIQLLFFSLHYEPGHKSMHFFASEDHVWWI